MFIQLRELYMDCMEFIAFNYEITQLIVSKAVFELNFKFDINTFQRCLHLFLFWIKRFEESKDQTHS